MTSTSVRVTNKKAIFTLYLDSTLEYVTELGVSVMCPPATKQAFQVKSIFTSKMM